MATLFGGRIAEELIFGSDSVTTGASNDIERATTIARNMVTKWGLSEKLGPMTYAEEENEVFLGRATTNQMHISPHTQEIIDTEVRDLIDRNYLRAENILKEKIDILHAMAEALMTYETIDENQIKDMMDGKKPQPPKDWSGPSMPQQSDNEREATKPDLNSPAAEAWPPIKRKIL